MSATFLFLLAGGHPAMAGPVNLDETYPYRSAEFSQFVNDSYHGEAGSQKFYRWLDQAVRVRKFQFKDEKGRDLRTYLAFKANQLKAMTAADERSSKERAFAADLHRLVKATLPKFSLADGFEFKNAVGHGQRQCFLQSVLIAGLLQKGGVRAGVAMVNCNVQGEETNNKHAVAVARLSNGHDLVVDASEDEPFAKQQGLFVSSEHGYRFVRPVYLADQSITGYRPYENSTALPITEIRLLPRTFIRSQFDYYRGERTNGGVMAKSRTEKGLATATKYLMKSVKEEPQNPLAQYMLGRIYQYRGQKELASVNLDKAMTLYTKDGWVPPDEKTALMQVKGDLN